MAWLGIDIGTTSIKCCYIDKNSGNVHYSQQVHNASTNELPLRNEQSVKLILDAIQQALKDLCGLINSHELNIESIGLCCQMHGIVFWNNSSEYSNLITWQDKRCDNDFISSLKTATNSDDLHTGYGCATLVWLTNHNPKFLDRYRFSGSIADLFVYILCELGDSSFISDHNAQSWGFFDPSTREWDRCKIDLSGLKFNLPNVIKSGTVVGKVKAENYYIRNGAKVYIPIGDLQASVYSVLGNKNGKVFNYGTASQLVKVLPRKDTNIQLLPKSARIALYTDKFDIITAASLNGGNAVETVFKLFSSPLSKDNGAVISYEKMMDLAFQCRDTSLRACPVFHGERHDTETYGIFYNIKTDNFTIGDMSAAVFRGIIDNLSSMMPDFTSDNDPFFAVGIAERRILQHYVKQIFGEFIPFDKDVNAAYGAVLYNIESEV